MESVLLWMAFHYQGMQMVHYPVVTSPFKQHLFKATNGGPQYIVSTQHLGNV